MQLSHILIGVSFAVMAINPAYAETVAYAYQGENWTPEAREAYYTQDQGSQIMPLSWFRALKTANGAPFVEGQLARYGYLPMRRADYPDLPVGFSVNAYGDEGDMVGMTCAACHTRQLEVGGAALRVDGGPAFADFQTFLEDLDASVAAVLASDAAFDAFAAAVGEAPQTLRPKLEVWYRRYHVLIERAMPDPRWGPSRLDAISMIFNRVAGLDIGAPENDYIIEDNIRRADAPTRYPFLWNAPTQNKTQWLGFADNGNSLLGLSRNLGEVYGVFARFHPKKRKKYIWPALNTDFIGDNSANFSGLKALEQWVRQMEAPRWPWALDADLVQRGAEVFGRSTESGGCAECHGKKIIPAGLIKYETWDTPILDVGTDARQCGLVAPNVTVKTGVLEGAKLPWPIMKAPLGETASPMQVLSTVVLGAIIQEKLRRPTLRATPGAEQPTDEEVLAKAFVMRPECKYESRVLEGVWAAAPYLHNGSVPTLADLLKPVAQRPANFPIGAAYDIDAVGLSADQADGAFVLRTTDCGDPASGDSRCGHEYGATLEEADKRALIEYLKSI